MRGAGGGARRPWLVPEALQVSALDCGPAALASLLGGFGLDRCCEELREACRTGRDGTSVDALEEVAIERGLDAEQILVPVEYPTLAEAACVPCILIVALPSGAAHFVTLWRLHGRRAQVMDPAVGRRWPGLASLEREIYRHCAVVPAAAWRAWAASGGALRAMAARLAALGIGGRVGAELIESAAGAAGWLPLAALDAAVRFLRQLVAAGGVRRGGDTGRLLRSVLERALEPAGQGNGMVPPAGCWAARPAAAGADGGERVACEGAVLVRVCGLRPQQASGPPSAAARPAGAGGEGHRRAGGGAGRQGAPTSQGQAAAVKSDGPGRMAGGTGAHRREGAAGRERTGSVAGRGRTSLLPGVADGTATGVTLALATAGAAGCRCAETALLVAALEILATAPSPGLHSGLIGGLLAPGVIVLWFELTAAGAAQALGRRRETGLRLRLAVKLPRLPDRYLRTRLLADLAERAHRIGDLQRGPEVAAATLGGGLDLVLATAGIVWLDPRLAGGALAVGAGALLVPLLLLPRYEERARRVRSHGGELAALYLDVLRGRAAIRAHGAASAFRRRHEELLGGWLRARRAAEAAGTWLEAGVQGLLSLAAAGLVLSHARRRGLDPQSLVLALWAFQAIAAGQRLALLAGRALPLDRSLRRRIAEPLAAAEEAEWAVGLEEQEEGEAAGAGSAAAGLAAATAGGGAAITMEQGSGGMAAAERQPAGGMALRWEGFTVESDGRPVLRELDLVIAAGEHVAVLGSSGAGKSTLLGTLLGWYRPAAGSLWVDGRRFDGALAAEVRRAVAWAAPEVALWRGSLLANLGGEDGLLPEGDQDGGPGSEEAAMLAPAEALRAARLLELVPRLAGGLQEPVGEAGGRLSGGEGQRLRFARALRRTGVRLALLDEPFRGLGPDARCELLETARARWRLVTMLCVSHSPREAAAFDRVVVLERGRVVEEGAPGVLAGCRGSHFRAMLDAEVRAAAALGDAGWRRLRLAAGSLSEVHGAEEGVVAGGRRQRRAAGAAMEGAVTPGAGSRGLAGSPGAAGAAGDVGDVGDRRR